MQALKLITNYMVAASMKEKLLMQQPLAVKMVLNAKAMVVVMQQKLVKIVAPQRMIKLLVAPRESLAALRHNLGSNGITTID
jgi:hypothetical protein